MDHCTLSTPPDHQPLSRPTEQLNVALSELCVTRHIAVFLAFFTYQNVVPCRHVTQLMHEGRHVLECLLAGV